MTGSLMELSIVPLWMSSISSARFIILMGVFTLATTVPSRAQDPVVTQWNSWYMYFGNHRLSDRWGLHTEYQWRREDWGECWQQSLLRVGADLYLESGPQVTAGYAWIHTFPYGEQPVAYDFSEHRIWEQLILKQSAGIFNFQHRYRLEQRFIERKSLNPAEEYVTDEWIFRQRARYRLYVAVPITKKKIEPGALFISAYDEVFLGFGEGIGANVLDQNRLYGAFGYQFTKEFQLQLGYLNQYVFKPDGVHAERNHTLQVGMFYNLDLGPYEGQ